MLLGAAGPEAAGSPRIERQVHGAADRIVIRIRRAPGFAVRQNGAELVLEVSGLPGGLATPPAASSGWVRGIVSNPGGVRLLLAPDAQPRVRVLADRIVVDVDGAAAALQPGQFRPAVLPRPAVMPKRAREPALPAARAIIAAVSTPEPGATPQKAAGLAQATPPPMMQAASVSLQPGSAGQAGGSLLLPADRLTGAAAFTRNGELHVVLDSPRLADLSQLKDDPVFGAATERLLPDGAELRMRLPKGAVPVLVHQPAGWMLTLGEGPGTPEPMSGTIQAGTLALGAANAGHVVSVEDEATGGRLLVGTQRDAGQRVLTEHRSAEWVLLPSWQGAVIQPLADRVRLLSREGGFTVSASEPPALAAVWPDGAAAVAPDGRPMTRRFDLPALPAAMLQRRLAEALHDAAVAPLASRAAPRLRVAQAMLACGLDAEAAAVLQVAAADAPALMRDATWQGLGAMAAWSMARAGGGPAAPPGFDPAALGDSDEAMLWRALWQPGSDQAAAAGLMAGRWRLLLGYPEPLRHRVLPAAAELLAAGGQDAALRALLAAVPDPALDLVRATGLLRQGRTQDGLAMLDRIAARPDRLARAEARAAAAEARLAAHMITVAQAADALDGQLYAWRGDDRELRLRLRIAALRTQAGAWRPALALLAETEHLFPAAQAELHAAQVGVVSGLLHNEQAAQLNALDLVALADAAAGLLGAADTEAALAPLLADRLLALDLPDRAEPILRRLLDRAGDGAARPGLGLRLARLVAERGDARGALDVLDRSHNDGEPAAEPRVLLRARLLAELGRAPEALAELAGLQDPAGVEMQASLRESAHDWAGASQALCRLTADPSFVALPAPERQALVLRAARDASEVGDMAALRALRGRFAALFTRDQGAGLFGVLTAEPVARVSDLPRAARELGEMRALPAALKAIRAS